MLRWILDFHSIVESCPGLPIKGLVASAFDLLVIFLCSLIPILNLTPPPNNASLVNLDM